MQQQRVAQARAERSKLTNRSVVLFQLRLVADVAEHGQQEGECLATSGLRYANQIAS